MTRAFPLLAELQPVRWNDDGLVLMPAAANDVVTVQRALARCPLPLVPLVGTPLGIWPDPPSRWSSGIYRRSPVHAPAPPGIPEIIQSAGDGFGPGDHQTTMMCLERLRELPSGDALDVGCGSGLLALAWARLGKGNVYAIDVDARATRQTAASAEHSGLREQITVECTRVNAQTVEDAGATTVLANVPAEVHLGLALALTRHVPRAALISGIRPSEAAITLAAYSHLGLRRSGASRRGRWECHLMVAEGSTR